MISEKTVELNVTTEILNYLWWKYGKSFYALAPSQKEEATFPIDAGVLGHNGAVLFQYKRAYLSKRGVWSWHLNRNKGMDQHLKLQQLEACGCAVFYVFPLFCTETEIALSRRRLLAGKTIFYRPSRINPVGGPTGHHEVHYDPRSRTWTVSSEKEEPIGRPSDLDEVENEIVAAREKSNAEVVFRTFNKIFSRSQDRIKGSRDGRGTNAVIVSNLDSSY